MKTKRFTSFLLLFALFSHEISWAKEPPQTITIAPVPLTQFQTYSTPDVDPPSGEEESSPKEISSPDEIVSYFDSFDIAPIKAPSYFKPYHRDALTENWQAFKNGLMEEAPFVRGSIKLHAFFKSALRRKSKNAVTIGKIVVFNAKYIKNDARSLVKVRQESLDRFYQQLEDRDYPEAARALYFAEKAHSTLLEVVKELPAVHAVLSEYYRDPKKSALMGGEFKSVIEVATDIESILAAKENYTRKVESEGSAESLEEWRDKNAVPLELSLSRNYINGQTAGDSLRLLIISGITAGAAAASIGILSPFCLAGIGVQTLRTSTKIIAREALEHRKNKISMDPTLTPDEKLALIEKATLAHAYVERVRKIVGNVASTIVSGFGIGFLGAEAAVLMGGKYGAFNVVNGLSTFTSRSGIVLATGGKAISVGTTKTAEFVLGGKHLTQVVQEIQVK